MALDPSGCAAGESRRPLDAGIEGSSVSVRLTETREPLPDSWSRLRTRLEYEVTNRLVPVTRGPFRVLGRDMPQAWVGPPTTSTSVLSTIPGSASATLTTSTSAHCPHPSPMASAIALVLPNIDSYTIVIFMGHLLRLAFPISLSQLPLIDQGRRSREPDVSPNQGRPRSETTSKVPSTTPGVPSYPWSSLRRNCALAWHRVNAQRTKPQRHDSKSDRRPCRMARPVISSMPMRTKTSR